MKIRIHYFSFNCWISQLIEFTYLLKIDRVGRRRHLARRSRVCSGGKRAVAAASADQQIAAAIRVWRMWMAVWLVGSTRMYIRDARRRASFGLAGTTGTAGTIAIRRLCKWAPSPFYSPCRRSRSNFTPQLCQRLDASPTLAPPPLPSPLQAITSIAQFIHDRRSSRLTERDN